MSKKNSPGCKCCGPCCSRVWDYVRADGASTTVTINGTASGLPLVGTVNLVESVTSGGVTTYQCSAKPYPQEIIASPASPRHAFTGQNGTANVVCEAYASIEVLACLPSASLRVTEYIRYGAQVTSNPESTITGLGYAFDDPLLNPFASNSYILNSPGFLQSVINVTPGQSGRFTGSPGTWRLLTQAIKTTDITDVNQMLEYFTFPRSLAPTYNPLSYSMDWDVL